ncbi:hypothetical protein FEM48_Zijuj11G0101400 [Ziziphus jujuba var. spinosa]|uniref:Uncharacterized protein n=1 Tax=Ziziphus jujuba var. spinosa TaxID=714518 RepID=A0A978UIC0_ZIZJJ|nr:hypothetical protein FEM48_Zijuj11G0101400 [Ziziphus jujuba var. spinosa]
MEIIEKPHHVVVHPFPAQGHIKPMLCLAQLLSEAGLYITFIITHHIHKRLADYLPSLTARFPNLHFQSISDGFPDDHPRKVNSDYFNEMKIKTKPHFKQAVVSLGLESSDNRSSRLRPAVSCIIADGYLVYSFDVAEELTLPIFTFVSHGACFLQAYYCIPTLIQQGHLPFPDDDMNHEIKCVIGLEGLLRRKNLPSVCMLREVESPVFQSAVNDILGMNRSSGVIINTFDELEVECLPHVDRGSNSEDTDGKSTGGVSKFDGKGPKMGMEQFQVVHPSPLQGHLHTYVMIEQLAKFTALKFDGKGPKMGMEQFHVVHPSPLQGHIKPILCLA